MKKRTLEKIVRWSIVGLGIITSTVFTYSIFSPSGKGKDVSSLEMLSYGKPKQVNLDFDNSESDFTLGSIYPIDIKNYSDQSKRSLIYPQAVEREEYDVTRGAGMMTHFEAMKPARILLKNDEKYSLQFDCPRDMKKIQISYAGTKLNHKIWEDKDTGKWIVKSNFEANEGENLVKVEVEYHNGEKDYFSVPMDGQ